MTRARTLIQDLEHMVGAWGYSAAIGQPTAVAIPLALAESPIAQEGLLLRSCVRCDRVRVDGRWASMDDAVRALRTFELPTPPSFAPTLCAHCAPRP
jgi:hypothetical protein